MKIEFWPPNRIQRYVNNPRHNEAGIEAVKRSLEEFGFQQPLVVDADGVLIAGHTRLLAAQELELPLVPVFIASNLTPDQVKAYRIADNKTHEGATWNAPKLRVEMEKLELENFDLSVTGFSAGSIAALMAPPLQSDPAAASTEDETSDSLLEWGKNRVPLTEEELELLSERFEGHLEETGLAYGFVRSLLGEAA